jgi:hypothetical protein
MVWWPGGKAVMSWRNSSRAAWSRLTTLSAWARETVSGGARGTFDSA